MGLQTNFNFLKRDFKNAYVKLEVVKWLAVEDEIQEDINGEIHFKWDKKPMAEAIFFIYGDKLARDNRVNPLSQISVRFDFDPSLGLNIFNCAYNELKEIPEFAEGLDIYDDEPLLVS